MLDALQSNKALRRLTCEQQKYSLSRALMTVVGNLVCYDNNTLEILQLGGNRGIMQLELDDGDNYDQDMVTQFRKEVFAKSNIKCLSL